MSDESYSSECDLSDYEHRTKAQCSTSEKNNCKTREFKRKSRCSSETERISISRNRSYSATTSNNAVSVPGQLRHRSRSETKSALILLTND